MLAMVRGSVPRRSTSNPASSSAWRDRSRCQRAFSSRKPDERVYHSAPTRRLREWSPRPPAPPRASCTRNPALCNERTASRRSNPRTSGTGCCGLGFAAAGRKGNVATNVVDWMGGEATESRGRPAIVTDAGNRAVGRDAARARREARSMRACPGRAPRFAPRSRLRGSPSSPALRSRPRRSPLSAR